MGEKGRKTGIGYIELNIPLDVHREAVKYNISKGSEGMNQHTERKGLDAINHYLEYVSEKLVAETFGWIKEESDEKNRDYDLISDKGFTVDVKCRGCESIPKAHFEGGCHNYYSQKCDFYCFTRADKGRRKLWILGFMHKKDFLKKGHIVEAGSFGADSNKEFRKEQRQIYLRDLYWPKYVEEKFDITPYKK